PRPQLDIQQDVRDRSHHLVHRVRIEQDRRPVHYFRQRRRVRTYHRPPARHRFQCRQPEAFVETRKHEHLARVVELQQLPVRHKSQKPDPLPSPRFPRRFFHLRRKPRRFPHQHQLVLQLRIRLHQLREGPDQPDVVLPRLDVSHRQDERSFYLVPCFHRPRRRFPRHRPEFRCRRIRHHHHLVFLQIPVYLQNRRPRHFRARQNFRRPPHRAPHRHFQLPCSPVREVLRMLQEAHVVDRRHHRHRARQRSRVLHVQQVRPVFPYLHRQGIAQPRKRVHRHAPRADVGGNACTRILCRHGCHNLAVAILGGEGVQQARNVDFIPRQVPADGVCINSDAHESYQYNGPSYRPKHQKSNFLQAFSHVNSRSSKSRPALPNSCRSVEELNSRDTADANAAPPSANSRFSPSRPGRPSAPIGRSEEHT